MADDVLFLTRRDVAALMSPLEHLQAVTAGFIALGNGDAKVAAPLHLPLAEGGCHGKAAQWRLGGRCFVALKFNANLPSNPARHGLPTIQGTLLLCDGDNGRLLAVMDAIELTLRRTAAATALAARHLAPSEAQVMTLVGCGAQALPHIAALTAVLPLRRVMLCDRDPAQVRSLIARATAPTTAAAEPAVAVAFVALEPGPGLEAATRSSDVIVTCTPSTSPYLDRGAVRPGCFIAAIGADSPTKNEIAPQLMAASTVVVDSLAQCLEMGDLHHAVQAGAMRAEHVHAELSELARGRTTGRRHDDEICLFDSTGVAVQDLASATRVYERARESNAGRRLSLDAP